MRTVSVHFIAMHLRMYARILCYMHHKHRYQLMWTVWFSCTCIEVRTYVCMYMYYLVIYLYVIIVCCTYVCTYVHHIWMSPLASHYCCHVPCLAYHLYTCTKACVTCTPTWVEGGHAIHDGRWNGSHTLHCSLPMTNSCMVNKQQMMTVLSEYM